MENVLAGIHFLIVEVEIKVEVTQVEAEGLRAQSNNLRQGYGCQSRKQG